MLRWLWRLNDTRRLVRWPIKCGILAFTVLAVCFPNPVLLARHLAHWRDPNALIEPDAAALAPMVAALRKQLAGLDDPRDVLRAVEKFVYAAIPYDWDWNTWGSADYLPTVTETIEMGREDCDGQAVVAASLLRNFGFKTELVANFSHMWVRTDKGEVMSPGKNKAVVATKHGPELHLRGLLELPKSMAFGIAVFPLMREIIVLVVIWLLLIHRRRRALRQGVRLFLFAVALLVLRGASEDYRKPVVWLQWLATVTMVASVIAQVRRPACEISSGNEVGPPENAAT